MPEKKFLKSEWNTCRTLLGYWVVVLSMLVIGSFVPFSGLVHTFFMIDTLAHLGLYTMLSFIPMILLRSRKIAFLLSVSMTPIGYLLETVHMMVTGDTFNVLNVLANNIGVIMGIGAGFIVRLKLHYNPAKQSGEQPSQCSRK